MRRVALVVDAFGTRCGGCRAAVYKAHLNRCSKCESSFDRVQVPTSSYVARYRSLYPRLKIVVQCGKTPATIRKTPSGTSGDIGRRSVSGPRRSTGG